MNRAQCLMNATNEFGPNWSNDSGLCENLILVTFAAQIGTIIGEINIYLNINSLLNIRDEKENDF